jgi:hypothetical protein
VPVAAKVTGEKWRSPFMITIFGVVRQYSAKKLPFFLKVNFMIAILATIANLRRKSCPFSYVKNGMKIFLRFKIPNLSQIRHFSPFFRQDTL